MLISHNWLQKYFDKKLPSANDIADKLIFHAFEVESVEEKNGDFLFDVKILPDRAHDCLCHYGLVREIGALFNIAVKKPTEYLQDIRIEETKRDLNIRIENENLCRRYIGRLVENVQIGGSSKALRKDLEKLEQRSINNVVDVANYVMFDVGQPLHAFDADKVKGGITVRRARVGEKITTLDNQEVSLNEEVLIIADDEGPLAIAGIKGGKKAEVTDETRNLILESANFDPVNIRRTSQKIGIKTDASKRFENELSTEVTSYAMDLLTDLIVKEAGTKETRVGEKIDEYKSKNMPASIEFATKEFGERLGIEIPSKEIIKILESLGIKVEVNGEKIKVTPPFERIDLIAKENYVEEVGRIYGYDKIAGRTPGHLEAKPPSEAEKRFEFANKLRVVLKDEGFTEVYGYAFTDKGEVELANPLSVGKEFLRTNLTDLLVEKLKFNLPYILFDNEAVKIFEIGKVFTGGEEETHLALGVSYRKKIKGRDAQKEVEGILGKLEVGPRAHQNPTSGMGDEVTAIQEINFDELVEKSCNLTPVLLDDLVNKEARYKTFSPYPRIIRDVAMWVPENITAEAVIAIIKKSIGDLCVVGPVLFDEFIKEGRKSLAFRLVFQSHEKTLSDDEANVEMTKVIEALEKQSGFEVRK